LCEPGTGKTKVALDFIAALYLYKGVKRVLVICPLAAFGVWEREVEKHLPPEVPPIVIQLHKKRALGYLHNGYHPDHLLIAIVNYETSWRVIKQLLSWKPQVVILDESHKVKNGTTKQARGCHRLGRVAPYRLILTGTPISNSPLDVFSQWKFLNPSRLGHSFRDFAQQYASYGGYAGYQIMAYKNLGGLQNRLAPDAFVVKKVDCLDLPEKIFQRIPVTLSRETRSTYQQMEKDMVAQLEEGQWVIAPIVLTKLLRLSQITSGFVTTEYEKAEHIGDEKLAVLEDLIEDYCLGPRNKVVIFCRFIPSLNRIVELLQERQIPYRSIYGGVSLTKRQEAVDQMWQKGPGSPQVIVCQIVAGGLSIDLACCSTAIFYELDYSLDHYIQAQDRLHRLGQKNRVNYLHLLASDTVDEEIYAALQEKDNVALSVLDRLRIRITRAA